MYKSILVIGGTKQMGIHLIEGLITQKYDITVTYRGKTGECFGDKINRIVVDRFDEKMVEKCFSGKDSYFDAVIDTNAFNGVV